jgi:hypothetical protein
MGNHWTRAWRGEPIKKNPPLTEVYGREEDDRSAGLVMFSAAVTAGVAAASVGVSSSTETLAAAEAFRGVAAAAAMEMA